MISKSGGALCVLTLLLTVAATSPALAQGRTQARPAQARSTGADPAGGIGLFLGAGFPIDQDREEPNTFRMGPRGWLWLHRAERARLGLTVPFTIGFGNRERRFDTRSVVVYELAPSLKGALQLSDLVRPYGEFGMGAALVTRRYRFNRPVIEDSRTLASFLLRTAVGVEVTPRRKVEGLLIALELVGVHGRVGGHEGVDLTLMMGVGYEL